MTHMDRVDSWSTRSRSRTCFKSGSYNGQDCNERDASGSSDRDPTEADPMCFITHIDVASFDLFIGDRTEKI